MRNRHKIWPRPRADAANLAYHECFRRPRGRTKAPAKSVQNDKRVKDAALNDSELKPLR